MIRNDQSDVIYKTEEAKYQAVVDDIAERHETGQPVLVGTTSVDKSEMLGTFLKKRGIPHHVLNAKNHAKEADIIAQAGQSGAVTVATNMAGRGTDIMLGGNPEYLAASDLRSRGIDEADEETYATAWEEALEKFEETCKAEAEDVKDAGGLYVLGTERHESRRIDNQLRGRAGPPGRPGRVAVLPLALRRPDEAVQRRCGARHDEPAARARRRADRLEARVPPDRVGAVADRGPQRRDPQERPQVRRGHEQPAHRHLRRAAQGAQRRRRLGADRALHRRHARGLCRGRDGGPVRRRLGPAGAVERVQAAVPDPDRRTRSW